MKNKPYKPFPVSRLHKRCLHIWEPVFMDNVYFFKATTHAEFERDMRLVFPKAERMDEVFGDMAREGFSAGGWLQIATDHRDKAKTVTQCIWCKRELSSFVHEIFHLVWGLLDQKGIRSDETGAYLIGFYVKEISKYFKFDPNR